MSCFHPKLALCLFLPGHNTYKVCFLKNKTSYGISLGDYSIDYGDDIQSLWKEYSLRWRKSLEAHPYDKIVHIPCGKCLGCLNQKADDWSKRIQLEASYFPSRCWFVTLTYDDRFLCWSNVRPRILRDDEGACDTFVPTLYKRDITTFLKNVRYRFGDGIRFFCCGEYGPKNGRPHYHMILFNLDLWSLDKNGKPFLQHYGKETDKLYTCEVFQDCWKPPNKDVFDRARETMGNILIAPYEPATGRYVAKYLVKPQSEEESFFDDYRQKPFLLMSRRPGIGRAYYDEHKDTLLANDSVCLTSSNGAFNTSLPEYYNRIARADDMYDGIVFENKLAKNSIPLYLMDKHTDQSWIAYTRSIEEKALRDYKHRKEL